MKSRKIDVMIPSSGVSISKINPEKIKETLDSAKKISGKAKSKRTKKDSVKKEKTTTTPEFTKGLVEAETTPGQEGETQEPEVLVESPVNQPNVVPGSQPPSEGQPESEGEGAEPGLGGGKEGQPTEGEPSEGGPGQEPEKPAGQATNENEGAGKTKQAVAEKGAKAATKAIGKAIANAFRAALAWAGSAIGWPVIIGCGAVMVILLIILIAVAAHYAGSGAGGKTWPQAAGPNDPNVKKILSLTDSKKVVFSDPEDAQYVKDGKIDKRLAAALAYLGEHHELIRISHVVSAYNKMSTNTESGRFHDLQIANNISAHKDGLALDIDAIDYVKEKCNCGDKIPVLVKWQTLGDSEEGSDALNQIKKAEDVTKPEVKKALEKLGVKGLDQKDLVNKIKASAELSKVDSPYDLLDPKVISAFEKVGVTGMGNKTLQDGLKKLQAIQALYEMNLTDVNALKNPKVKELMAQAGMPVSDELIDSLGQYRASQILQNIRTLDDLKRPEVQEALRKNGIDPNDPNFQASLAKLQAAEAIKNWNGNPNDPAMLAALSQFKVTPNDDTLFALNILRASNQTFNGSPNDLNTEAAIVHTLEQLSIYSDSPDMQAAIQKMRAAEMINNNPVALNDPEYLAALNKLGIGTAEQDAFVLKKYKAANYVLDYQGDYTNSYYLSELSELGIQTGSDSQEAIKKYKASMILADAADGKIALDSQEVKDALKTIGATSITDDKGKAGVEVGKAKDPNDAKLASARQKIGLARDTYKDAMGKMAAAKNLMSLNEYSNFRDPEIQRDLAKLGMTDPKYFETLGKVGATATLMKINDLKDLQNYQTQNALRTLDLYQPEIFDGLAKLGSLQTLSKIDSLSDLQSPYVQNALQNLGIKDPAVYETLGQLGSIDTLLKVDSVWDLADPRVMDAMHNLGINDTKLQAALGQAGSVYILSQIKEPEDLLKPQSLIAMDNLGIIDLNSEMLGQIGAIQTLLQVDSIGDLFNPSTILALNTLGIIALSNPVTMGLMALSFLDNIFGGNFLGGIFGSIFGGGGTCKETTKCYKPAAQENIYKVTEELLQMPYDLGDKEFYRVTQLIVWKLDYIREKDPGLNAKLDALYWKFRPNNVGLFTMPEASANIHIGY